MNVVTTLSSSSQAKSSPEKNSLEQSFVIHLFIYFIAQNKRPKHFKVLFALRVKVYNLLGHVLFATTHVIIINIGPS